MLVALLGLAGSVGYFTYVQLRPEGVCEVCHRSVQETTAYEIYLEDGTLQKTCCPRCGLRFQKGRTDVASAEVTDFDTGQRFDANDAFFVEGSSVNLCHKKMVEEDRSGVQYQLAWDRCMPSLIAFKDRESAESFRRDYGGELKTYEEILREEEL
jgi:hypothetical protein